MSKLLTIFLFCFIETQSQVRIDFNPDFEPSSSNSVIQDKNFYLFTAFESNPELVHFLEENKVFQAIFQSKKKGNRQQFRIL